MKTRDEIRMIESEISEINRSIENEIWALQKKQVQEIDKYFRSTGLKLGMELVKDGCLFKIIDYSLKKSRFEIEMLIGDKRIYRSINQILRDFEIL